MKLKSLPFGAFNPELIRRTADHAISKRRTTPQHLQNNQLALAATGDSTSGKLQFPGVVLRTKQSAYDRRNSTLEFQSPGSGHETEHKRYIYIVHLRDLFANPDPPALDDSRIPIMTEALLDSTAVSSTSALGDASNNYNLTSRRVLVTFDNPRLFKGARIVSVGAYMDLPLFTKILSNTFVASAAGGGGGTSPQGTAGTSTKKPVGKGGELFFKGKPGTQHLAIGASYVRINNSFAKQMGMDRFAWSGQFIPYLMNQIDPAVSQGTLDLTKYTHVFFFAGPNSLGNKKKGAPVYTALLKLIAKVKEYNSSITVVVITINGFARWGFRKEWGVEKIRDVVKATQDYNTKIMAKDPEAGIDASIDVAVDWASEGTSDYTIDAATASEEELKKFSIKWGAGDDPDWDADTLHPNTAGHAQVAKMLKDLGYQPTTS